MKKKEQKNTKLSQSNIRLRNRRSTYITQPTLNKNTLKSKIKTQKKWEGKYKKQKKDKQIKQQFSKTSK